jgi:hypothetical protein
MCYVLALEVCRKEGSVDFLILVALVGSYEKFLPHYIEALEPGNINGRFKNIPPATVPTHGIPFPAVLSLGWRSGSVSHSDLCFQDKGHCIPPSRNSFLIVDKTPGAVRCAGGRERPPRLTWAAESPPKWGRSRPIRRFVHSTFRFVSVPTSFAFKGFTAAQGEGLGS